MLSYFSAKLNKANAVEYRRLQSNKFRLVHEKEGFAEERSGGDRFPRGSPVDDMFSLVKVTEGKITCPAPPSVVAMG